MQPLLLVCSKSHHVAAPSSSCHARRAFMRVDVDPRAGKYGAFLGPRGTLFAVVEATGKLGAVFESRATTHAEATPLYTFQLNDASLAGHAAPLLQGAPVVRRGGLFADLFSFYLVLLGSPRRRCCCWERPWCAGAAFLMTFFGLVLGVPGRGDEGGAVG